MDINTNIDTITLEVSNTITTNHDYENLINKPTLNSVELIGNKTSSDLGLQGVLTAGTNISISDENVISASGGGTSDYSNLTNKPSINNVTLSGNKTDTDLNLQHKLTAGANISISNNTISAQDTTYSAGNNVSISNGVISATDTRYSAGNGISISNENVISATGGGGGTTNYNDLSNKPSINNVTLSGNKTTSDLGITIPTKTSDLTNDSGFLTAHQDITGKQDKLIAGTNITIASDGKTISASGGGGGTTNYNDLSNKPSINNVTLTGNKTISDLGITIPTKTSDLTNDSGFLTSHQDISGKLDKYNAPSDGFTYMYGALNGNQVTVKAANTVNGSIVMRASGGNIIVPTPTANNYATPKSYVDNAISGILQLPSYTSSDEGKVLKIVNGVPTWTDSGGEEEMNATNWVTGDYDVGTTAWFVENGISKKNITYPDTSLYLEVTQGSQAGGYYINYNDVDYLYYFEDASMFTYENMACHFPAPSGWISQAGDKIEIRFSFKLVSVDTGFQKQVEIKYRYFRSL